MFVYLLLMLNLACTSKKHPRFPIEFIVDNEKSISCNKEISKRKYFYKYPGIYPLHEEYMRLRRCKIVVSNQEDLLYYDLREKAYLRKQIFVWSDVDNMCVEKNLLHELSWKRYKLQSMNDCEKLKGVL